MDTVSFSAIEQAFDFHVEGETIVHDIILRREGDLIGDATVEISLSESSGRISAADLQGGVAPRRTILLPDGQALVAFSITIATIDDQILDGSSPFYDETVVFELSNPEGVTISGAPTRVGAKIRDNDGVYEATPDLVIIDPGQVIDIDPLGNDLFLNTDDDQAKITILDQPQGGTLEVIPDAFPGASGDLRDGLRFTPDDGFMGVVSYELQIDAPVKNVSGSSVTANSTLDIEVGDIAFIDPTIPDPDPVDPAPVDPGPGENPPEPDPEPAFDLLQTLNTGHFIEGTASDDGKTIITYRFSRLAETFFSNEIVSAGADFVFSLYERLRIEAALQLYENFLNVDFVADRLGPADLTFFAGGLFGRQSQFVFTSVGDFGFAYLPDGAPEASNVVFNVEAGGWDRTSAGGATFEGGLEQFGLGFETIVHEIGHALGLDHPFEGVDSQLLPGLADSNGDNIADNPFEDTGAFDLNQTIFSIMSYTKGWTAHPDGTSEDLLLSLDFSVEDWPRGTFAGSPMALDIAALQQLYGANEDHANGDDVYALPEAPNADFGYSTIWDTGGTDTIEYNGTLRATIDLRAATLQLENGGGGFVSYLTVDPGEALRIGGFTIANGVVIENARGGAGDDILVGNAHANTLEGGEGNDSLMGYEGADLLRPGSGSEPSTSGHLLVRDFTGDPLFTIDGKMAIEELRDGSIVSIDLVTGHRTPVSVLASGEPANGNSFDTAVSPVGQKVAFASDAQNLIFPSNSTGNNIFLKDLETGQVSLVSADADGNALERSFVRPSFSPDGEKIAFYDNPTNDASIYVKDLVTGALQVFSDIPTPITTFGAPVFSPDGSKLAYASSGPGTISELDLATGEVRALTADADGSVAFSYSPDGQSLLFSSEADLVDEDDNGLRDIYLLDLSDGALTLVSAAADGTRPGFLFEVSNAQFSPDGQFVAFQSFNTVFTLNNSIFIKNLITGELSEVDVPGSGLASIIGPVFMPGGNRVAFALDARFDPDMVTGLYVASVAGLAGGNTIDGGAGQDTVDYSADGAALDVQLDAGLALRGDIRDTLANVENVLGSALGDLIVGDDADNRFDGFGGADDLRGETGNDTIFGGAEGDTLFGGANDDGLYGGDGDDTLDGGADTDGLFGEIGNDTLNGGTENDVLYGGADFDALDGGADDDGLYGGTGNDTLNGGTGADDIFGGDGDDLIIELAGSLSVFQNLSGEDGNDVYEIGAGAGLVSIGASAETDNSGEDDRVTFRDLLIYEATLGGGAAGELSFLWGEATASGELRIADGGRFIERYQFADGMVVNAAILASEAGGTTDGDDTDELIQGTAALDNLNGAGGNDVLDARGGSLSRFQNLNGQAGNDIYIYGAGDGRVNIGGAAETASSGEDDQIMFRDLNAYDFTLGVTGGGALRLFWNTGAASGELRVAHGGEYIETYKFADGSAVDDVTRADASGGTTSGSEKHNFIQGTSALDNINGGAGDDIIDAAGGSLSRFQNLNGQDGNDTYIYGIGDGRVNIGGAAETATSGTTDQLLFQDLQAKDFTLGQTGAGALRFFWKVGGQSGELRVANAGQFIEEFVFPNGDTFGQISLADSGGGTMRGTDTNDLLFGAAGLDNLNGGLGDDHLDAGTGNLSRFQNLNGEEGNDTYVYGTGDGRVNIGGAAERAETGAEDRIVFQDLEASDITLGETGAGALRFFWRIGQNSGELRVANGAEYIETIEFADGSEFAAILRAEAAGGNIIGSDANELIFGALGIDNIFAGAGDDHLDAGGGNLSRFQNLNGQEGNDTYAYGIGDGRVNIGNGAERIDTGTDDRVVFRDLNFSDITLGQTGAGAARFFWNKSGQSGELRIANIDHIESYEFANGAVMTFDEFQF